MPSNNGYNHALVQRITVVNDTEDDDPLVLPETSENESRSPQENKKAKQGCTPCKTLCACLTLLIAFLLGVAGRHEYALKYEHYSLPEFKGIAALFAGNDNTAEVCGNFGKFACNGLSESSANLLASSIAESVQLSARSRAAIAYANELPSQEMLSPGGMFFVQCANMVSAEEDAPGTIRMLCSTIVAPETDYAEQMRQGFSVYSLKFRVMSVPLAGGVQFAGAFVYKGMSLQEPGTVITEANDPCNLLQLYRDVACNNLDATSVFDCSKMSSVYVIGPLADVCSSHLRLRTNTPNAIDTCVENMLSIRTHGQCLDITAQFWNEPSEIFLKSQDASSARASHVLQVASFAVKQLNAYVHTLDDELTSLLDAVRIQPVLEANDHAINGGQPIGESALGTTFVSSYMAVNKFASSARLSNRGMQSSGISMPAWEVFPKYIRETNTLFLPTVGMTEWDVAGLNSATASRVSYLVSRTILGGMLKLLHESPAFSRILRYSKCVGVDSISGDVTLKNVANRISFAVASDVVYHNLNKPRAITINGVGSLSWAMQSTMGVASMMCTKGSERGRGTTETFVPDFVDMPQQDISLITMGMHAHYGCAARNAACKL